MSFGSDGASIMTGRVGSVSTLLRKENPLMINIHCMAHRLALCISQAANNVETMEKYRQLLTDLYYPNLVPRVFRLFGQRGNAGKTLGKLNFITAEFLR